MITFTVGRFFEEATAALTGGELLGLGTGRGYCPDLRLHNAYIECKAIGRSNRAILYEDRVRRQELWAKTQNVSVLYYFWKHHAICKRRRSKDRLREVLASELDELLIIPQSAVHQAFCARPPNVINKGNPPNYQHGWTPAYRDLAALCSNKPYPNSLRFDGLNLVYLTRTYDSTTLSRPLPDQK